MSQPTPTTRVDDRYELVERLEDQGAGESWKARDANIRGRMVAVKFLDALPAGVTALPDDLTKRLAALRSLRHANVLATVHHGLWNDRPFVVHDLFEGPSLAAGLEKAHASGRELPLALLGDFFELLCLGIEAAHGLSPPVTHGSVRPDCVLIQRLRGKNFDVRVTDFGLAPEGGVAADVHALGALLRSMVAASRGGDRARDDVPRPVRDAIRRAVDERPEERFRTVALLRDAVREGWSGPVEADALVGQFGVPAATGVRPMPAAPPPAALGVPAATALRPRGPAVVAADTVFTPNPASDASAPPAADTLFVANATHDESPWESSAEAHHVTRVVDNAPTTVRAPSFPPPADSPPGPSPSGTPWDTRLRQQEALVQRPVPAAPAQTSANNPWDTRVLQQEVRVQLPNVATPRRGPSVMVVTAIVVMVSSLALAAIAWALLAPK